ncbi:E3 ubiquitin-protein ligase [Armadillidium vulgare]|nr:E3 ubiquitin-protein ligase [Armadillidium vulgare]
MNLTLMLMLSNSAFQNALCPKRLVVCKYCELEIVAAESEKHLEYCGSRTDRCKGCTKYVQFKYLQFHYENDHKYLNPEEKEGNDGEDGEECPVCLGPVTLPLTLECGHMFCMVCVKGIANTTKNCAICRRDIQRDMLMDIRRSKSVPSRRVGITTEDYDSKFSEDMVSALLSSRTSSSNYRYQRPNNGHTPPNYTPYCYSVSSTTATTSTTAATMSNANNSTKITTNEYVSNDDDDCCSSFKRSSETKTSTTQTVVAPPRSHSANTKGQAPQQPNSSNSKNSYTSEPRHLSQVEYDRWFAFQLAQAEDENSSSEYNRAHRNPFRRSRSMPERNDDTRNIEKDNEVSDLTSCNENKNDAQSRLPPTSPRCTSSSSSTSAFSFTSNTRGSSLSKSSSDSSANGNSSTNTNSPAHTGARPKSSTGLKKRVSFKDETPRVKRQAPVMLPCEFCDEVFPERDLMRHQTSCDQNETKNPREYLLSRRTSVTSPMTSPSSPLPPVPNGLNSSLYATSSSRPPSGSSHSRRSESPSKSSTSNIKNLRTPPPSPSSRSRTNQSSITPPRSPSTPGTPTDIEVDFEDDDSAFSRPRKGKLISSAILSWKSISGGKPRDSLKYARSNTAPLDVSANSNNQSLELSTSQSASHLRAPVSRNDYDEEPTNKSENNDQLSPPVFRKNKNKYPAPPPPQQNTEETKDRFGVTNIKKEERTLIESSSTSSPKQVKKKAPESFKFDSTPVMSGKIEKNRNIDVIPCEFCKEVFPPEKFQAHQTMCEKIKDSPSQANHSKSNGQQDKNEQNSNIPAKRNKGPAPKPPSEPEKPRKKPVERSHSVRESSSESRYSKEFESSGCRLERAGSIKETSRLSSKFLCDSPPRKWLSREGFYGSTLDCSAAYSAGGSVTSSTTSINSYSGGSGWSSHERHGTETGAAVDIDLPHYMPQGETFPEEDEEEQSPRSAFQESNEEIEYKTSEICQTSKNA